MPTNKDCIFTDLDISLTPMQRLEILVHGKFHLEMETSTTGHPGRTKNTHLEVTVDNIPGAIREQVPLRFQKYYDRLVIRLTGLRRGK